jgi:hypothetical protein
VDVAFADAGGRRAQQLRVLLQLGIVAQPQ